MLENNPVKILEHVERKVSDYLLVSTGCWSYAHEALTEKPPKIPGSGKMVRRVI